MDRLAASIVYVITTCAACGRELAIAESIAGELILCADCDRPTYRTALTENVIPIEEDELEDDCA